MSLNSAHSTSPSGPGSRNQPLALIDPAAYAAVRRRLFRQLIESLVYEGVLRPTNEHVEPGSRWRVLSFAGGDRAGRSIHYRCRMRLRASFGRMRMDDGSIVRETIQGCTEADSLPGFLKDVQATLGCDDAHLHRFLEELGRTHCNDAQAQAARLPKPLRQADYDRVESRLPDGHPYHPCYKSRIGFTPAENVAYGPEFGNSVHPVWLAAHRDLAVTAVSAGATQASILAASIKAQWPDFDAALTALGARPEDYHLLPVHPWQWQSVVLPGFAAELADGRIIHLGTAERRYAPQQSIRTLADATELAAPSLKLALSIRNTSTARTLAPHTVRNAPLITDWLQALAAGDAYLRDHATVLLGEVMGTVVTHVPEADPDATTRGALACIWRESLHGYLQSGEGASPFNALAHIDTDGEPYIADWVGRYGVVPWLRRLLEVSVPPVLHFLVAHGIALESHAQNMVLIHRDGWPNRVALKDFHDGIRFARTALTAPERVPDLQATPESHARVNRNSYIETDNPAELRDFVHDALFFINLSEPALLLETHYDLPEVRFWEIAARVLLDYRDGLSADLAARFDRFDFFAPKVAVEQLTKRRLFPESEVRIHHVPNPLYAARVRLREIA